ncbi:leucine-rich_repeat domain-containing protein [Hexamita inflata]|uniref:Leucine-rich repeat domain-containing protein n=1 Tax=Hexamita inflata TaxID=28002 RepID=A0AA86QMN4_9EUKA|nr:leucine-rich repeat domain-containing protein [Hexamita inflata]
MNNTTTSYLDLQVKNQFINAIVNESLSIKNNDLDNIKFAEYLPIINIQLKGCLKIKFERCPSNITHLQINNSHLTNIEGIQQMTQLIYLNLDFNNILSFVPLLKLTKLQSCSLRDNLSFDDKQLTMHRNFSWAWLFESHINQVSQQNYLDYLKLSNKIKSVTQQQQQQFERSWLEVKGEINIQIQRYNFNYDQEMIQKYQTKVQNNKLIIQNDLNLRSILFVYDFCLITLEIYNCPLLQLTNNEYSRKLITIRKLIIKNCALRNIKYIKCMNYLEIVDLSNNNIVNAESLTNLYNLEHVYLNNNKLINTNLKNQQRYNQNFKTLEINNQSQPTEDEINDSNK